MDMNWIPMRRVMHLNFEIVMWNRIVRLVGQSVQTYIYLYSNWFENPKITTKHQNRCWLDCAISMNLFIATGLILPHTESDRNYNFAWKYFARAHWSHAMIPRIRSKKIRKFQIISSEWKIGFKFNQRPETRADAIRFLCHFSLWVFLDSTGKAVSMWASVSEHDSFRETGGRKKCTLMVSIID